MKCIDKLNLTIFRGLRIGKFIGAISWRDNNNLFIKVMVFSFIHLLENTNNMYFSCILCNLHATIYVFLFKK